MTLSIATKVKRNLAKQEKLRLELYQLRDECKHTHVAVTYKADTGNYCRGDDRYWKEIKCLDCGKCWDEDQ